MKITRMQPVHLEQVTALAAQLGYECSSKEMQTRYEAIAPLPDHALFVALEGERVLGWIHITVEPQSLLSGPRADIGGLVVEEQARGQGIGKSLIEAGENWAREKALPLVRVRTNTKRTQAHQFYAKAGYALRKSWHLFTKEI